VVDPYLSDAVLRSYQQPQCPSASRPLEVEADVLWLLTVTRTTSTRTPLLRSEPQPDAVVGHQWQ